jgi:hypothetical protein
MAIDDGGAQARVTEHETKQQLFLHDLEEGGGPVLRTFGGANDTRRASSGDLKFLSFDDGTTSPELLPLQEVVLKLHRDPLKLLLGLIALDDNEMSSHGGFPHALGFGVCGSKFDKHGPLFIGLLVLSRRGCGVLSFLSLNQNQTRLRWKDLERGRNRVRFDMVNRIPDRVSWPYPRL